MSKKKEVDEEHKKILTEILATRDDLKKTVNPLPIYLMGAIIIMLLVLWVLPGDFPARAQLNKIPTITEILPEGMKIPTRPESKKINDYILYEDAYIKLIAAHIVTKACSSNDPKCYANALFHFAKQVTYLNDPIKEYYETPQETLLAGAADCDGHAILLASLFRSVGILTEFERTPGHIAINAWLPANKLFAKKYTYEWVHYDATCKNCKPGQYMPLTQ